jgi:hypothetical protein
MRKAIIAIPLIVLTLAVLACGGEATAEVVATAVPEEAVEDEPEETIVEPSEEPLPEPTEAPTPTPIKVTINCPECLPDDLFDDEIGLTLWQEPDNMGTGGGKAWHGDQCDLLDETVVEGIAKVKIACPGGTGWLREEAIIRD